MKGHIRERSPGHYAIIIDLGDPATGKRKRKWHSFKGTKRQAQIECARLVSELNSDGYVEPAKTTLAPYLVRWLAHVRSQVAPRTYERYGEIVAQYIVPPLGHTPLTKLQPIAISEAYDKIRGRRAKGEGQLSARTILHCHRVLSAALRQAVRWRLLSYNPAADVKAPKFERRKMTTYSLTETADLLDTLRGSWMYVPALLVAKLPHCAGARSTSIERSLLSCRAQNRPKRPSDTRNRNQVRSAPWRCRPPLSPSCGPIGHSKPKTPCGSVLGSTLTASSSHSLTAVLTIRIQSPRNGACG